MMVASDTVVDVGLGLEWQRTVAPTLVYWKDALAQCKALSLAGHTDWRLASAKELGTLFAVDAQGAVTFGGGMLADPNPVTAPNYVSSTPDGAMGPTGEARCVRR